VIRGVSIVASAAAFAVVAACAPAPSPIGVSLVAASTTAPAHVRVTGLTTSEREALASARLSDSDWTSLLRVAVAGGSGDEPPVTGQYTVEPDGLRFTPRLPFEPGRPYAVSFNPARLPKPRDQHAVAQVLTLPAIAHTPTTVVTRALPTSAVVPENLRHIYLEFSAAMAPDDGLQFVRLIDERGLVVPSAFLPPPARPWNPERTRYTLTIDPGRTRPDASAGTASTLGRTLRAGHRYTIEVDARWPDAAGQPLALAYRQMLQVGPADVTPVDPRQWQFTVPTAGRRDPAIVTFPDPIDPDLLGRSLGVARDDGTPIAGTIRVDPGETRWNFVPDDPWRPGQYALLVLSNLEDLAGNGIGRRSDAEWFLHRDTPSPPPTQTKMPFEIK
jgi:hypothetical protein